MLLTENFPTTVVGRLPRGVRPPAITRYDNCSLASFFDSSEVVTLVADLALDLVRPNAVAVQLCQQLGIAPSAHQSGLPQTADVIGALIDRETHGFAPMLAAHSHAENVLAAMTASGRRYRIVLIPPPEHAALGEENAYFLQFLAEQSPTLELCAIGGRRLHLSPAWIVVESTSADVERATTCATSCAAAYFPGILDGQQAERLTQGDPAAAGLLPLPNHMWAVPPSSRQTAPRGGLPERAQITSLLELPDPWLRAYAIVRLQLRAQVSALIGFGLRAVAEGGHRVALALIEAARAMTSDPLTAAQLEAMAWGTRIGIEDFDSAANAALPNPALPSKLRVHLLQHKAWALAMTGRLPEAQALLDEACTLLANPEGIPSREYLYLLNITAFIHFRRGQLREAFELERQMTEGIARLAKPDQHLEYVSCMNLGRLHLRAKEPEKAHAFFERANATSSGLRTLADRMTMHVNRARVAELRRDSAEARRHWLRAALAWASDPLPESLSARAARLLLGQQSLPRHLWFAAINRTLAQRLEDLFGARAVEPDDVPTICSSSCLASPGHAEVVALASGAVAIAAERLEPSQDHPSHRTLRALLRRILAEESGSTELAAAGTLFVDDQNGTEPAATCDEAIAIAVRLGIPRVRFGSQIVFDHDCGDEDRVSWIASLSPAVLSVTTNAARQTAVAFRRYRTPRLLELTEAAPVLALVPGEHDLPSLAAATGWTRSEILMLFRRLERDRIVMLRVKSPAPEPEIAPAPAAASRARTRNSPEAAERFFQDIYSHHITIVWKTVHAFATTKEDQEDLFQEILIALWEALPYFESRSKLTTYVYRVAHRRALNWKRTQRRYEKKLTHYEHEWPELTIMSPEPADQSRLEWLYRSINTLKPIDRTICLLYLDGVSYGEMAEILGITQDNIGIRVHRCKRQLTALLNHSNDESLRRAAAIAPGRRSPIGSPRGTAEPAPALSRP